MSGLIVGKLEPVFSSLKPSGAPLNLDTVHQKEPIIVIVNKILCEEHKFYHARVNVPGGMTPEPGLTALL